MKDEFSLFNAHAMIFVFHIFMNVSKLYLKQDGLPVLKCTLWSSRAGRYVFSEDITEFSTHIKQALISSGANHWLFVY